MPNTKYFWCVSSFPQSSLHTCSVCMWIDYLFESKWRATYICWMQEQTMYIHTFNGISYHILYVFSVCMYFRCVFVDICFCSANRAVISVWKHFYCFWNIRFYDDKNSNISIFDKPYMAICYMHMVQYKYICAWTESGIKEKCFVPWKLDK